MFRNTKTPQFHRTYFIYGKTIELHTFECEANIRSAATTSNNDDGDEPQS